VIHGTSIAFPSLDEKMMPSRTHLGAALLLCVGIAASPAAAETPVHQPGETGEGAGAQPEPGPAGRSSWYGYQILLADAVALGLTAIAAEAGSEAVLVGAAGVYLLGGPTVHALHRRPLAAVASLGLRIALPIAFAAIGGASVNCRMGGVVNDGESCGSIEPLIGLTVGLVAAVAIDSAAVAWDWTPPAAADRAAPRAESLASVSVAPIRIREGAGLVLSGRF